VEFPLLCRSLLPEIAFHRASEAFPENLEIIFHHTWVPDPKDLADSYKPRRTPLPGSLGFVFHTVAKVVGGVEETRYRLKMGSERPR
jgi:hypothetical protein